MATLRTFVKLAKSIRDQRPIEVKLLSGRKVYFTVVGIRVCTKLCSGNREKQCTGIQAATKRDDSNNVEDVEYYCIR